jgi:asparagine synthase (glutamine-hydrolysing)
MCGIAGYYSERAFGEEVLKAMTRALRYRGPDAEGFFNAERIHFGHRRLSVIDVAGSAQPLFNEDHSVVLVFNGEIYNFQSLRKDLVAAGHRFRTHGDSEVLVHAYEEYGHGMLGKLSGMFAFAIWDKARQSLFVARDHLGVKPLYYYWDGSVFVFGSELKAILPHPAVKRDIDLDALGLYLECQYIPAPRSVYAFIKKLRAGHFLVLQQAEAGGERARGHRSRRSGAEKISRFHAGFRRPAGRIRERRDRFRPGRGADDRLPGKTCGHLQSGLRRHRASERA